MKKRAISFLPKVFLFIILSFTPVTAGEHSFRMPEDIDASATYLFFLHNYYVEKNGTEGDCRYQEILNGFSENGYRVISEIRTGKIIPCTYADRIVDQVRHLMDAGVPPEHIVVSGHSKGGVIGLCVASKLNQPDVRFVIMAGCEIAGLKKYNLYPDPKMLTGEILSVYAASDTVASSCENSFSKASQGLSGTEIRLESDAGHRLFFAPDPVWLTPVVDWLEGTP